MGASAAFDRDRRLRQLARCQRALREGGRARDDDGSLSPWPLLPQREKGRYCVEDLEAAGDVVGIGGEALERQGVAFREQQHALRGRLAEPRSQLIDDRLGMVWLRDDDQDRLRRVAGECGEDGSLGAVADAEHERAGFGHAAAQAIEVDRLVDDGQ